MTAMVCVGILGGAVSDVAIHSFGSKKPTTASQQQPQPIRPQSEPVIPQITTPMPWPSYGVSAYGVPEDNLFASSKTDETPVPIASLAKIITALAILQKKPLQPGEQGPMIALDAQDVELVNEYARKDGTYVQVLDGEKISEYQALQAMLLVSANNMADSLVRWAFGSMDAYVAYANNMLKDQHIEHASVADASGFSPSTVSTAKDMTRIGYLYITQPVLRQIATQEQATIPVEGEIKNYNSFANEPGIIGLKIGNTDEAKKTFITASIHKGPGSSETISIAVVLGAENLKIAAQDAVAILKAGDAGRDQLKRNL